MATSHRCLQAPYANRGRCASPSVQPSSPRVLQRLHQDLFCNGGAGLKSGRSVFCGVEQSANCSRGRLKANATLASRLRLVHHGGVVEKAQQSGPFHDAHISRSVPALFKQHCAKAASPLSRSASGRSPENVLSDATSLDNPKSGQLEGAPDSVHVSPVSSAPKERLVGSPFLNGSAAPPRTEDVGTTFDSLQTAAPDRQQTFALGSSAGGLPDIEVLEQVLTWGVDTASAQGADADWEVESGVKEAGAFQYSGGLTERPAATRARDTRREAGNGGRSDSRGFGISRSGGENDAGISDGVSASLGGGGWSLSALEAALRNSANGAQSAERSPGGVSGKGLDSPSESLTEHGAAGLSVKDRWDGQLPDRGTGRGNGKNPEKRPQLDRGSSATGVRRRGVSVGAERAAPTLADERKSKRVDTIRSGVSGAWAQWLNGVSRDTGAPQRPEAVGAQDGTQKTLGKKSGGRKEGLGAPKEGNGEQGPGEEYAVTGVSPETGVSGAGLKGSGLVGLLTDLEKELRKGDDLRPDLKDGHEMGFAEGDRLLESAVGQGAPLKSIGLQVKRVPAWEKDGARKISHGARSTGAEATGRFEEGSQGREGPLVRRKPLQYERLSPSELFGEEPFDLIVSGREVGGDGLQAGRSFAQEENQLRGVDRSSGGGEMVPQSPGVDAGTAEEDSKGPRDIWRAAYVGELSNGASSRGQMVGLQRKNERGKVGQVRSWGANASVGDAAGDKVGEQASSRNGLGRRLAAGRGAAGAKSWSESGLDGGFEAQPGTARGVRGDLSERQGRYPEREGLQELSTNGNGVTDLGGRQQASGKEEAWAAWQAFASGGERSPQEMSEFLAKWTAEHAANPEEAISEQGASGWRGTKRVVGEYGSEGLAVGFGVHGIEDQRAGSRSDLPRGASTSLDRGAWNRGNRRERSSDDSFSERPFLGEEASMPVDGNVQESGFASGRDVWQRSGGANQETRRIRAAPSQLYAAPSKQPVEQSFRQLQTPADAGTTDSRRRRADVSRAAEADAEVSDDASRGANVIGAREDAASTGADVSKASEGAVEWGVDEGANPDWVGDDQLGAATWQEWEGEDDDDFVQPTETDWQKVFVAAAARRLQRTAQEPETDPEPAETPAEAAPGDSPLALPEGLSAEEQKEMLLQQTLDLSVRNRVQKWRDSRPKKKIRDDRTMEERGFAVFLEVLPELERQKLICQKVKAGKLVWAPCCVYYVIHHTHTEILRFFNARTRALARQWKLGFSATKALNYYMRSSCALTLAIKNELKSRAAAYRKWGRELTDPVTRVKIEMKTPIPKGGWDAIDWDRPVGVRAIGGGYYTPEEMRVRARRVPQPITWKVPTVDDPTLRGRWDLGMMPPERLKHRTRPEGERRK